MEEIPTTMTAEALSRRLDKFWTWNGEDPTPAFTHWTPSGTFTIRPCTPGRPPTNEVLFNGVRLGFGHDPIFDADNLVRGSYDKELGFAASSTGVPADLLQWNNL